MIEITIVVASVIVVGVWMLFGLPPTAKNKCVESFPELLRSLYISMTNGSVLFVAHKGSDVEFSFFRKSGEEEDVKVELQIPRAEWSKRKAQEISESFESQGFRYCEEKGFSSQLGRIEFVVPNIWDGDCGASGAHAARILMNAVGLPTSARFDIRAEGESSERILKAKDHI